MHSFFSNMAPLFCTAYDQSGSAFLNLSLREAEVVESFSIKISHRDLREAEGAPWKPAGSEGGLISWTVGDAPHPGKHVV